ncbi:hypothetical protein ACFLXJ_06180 [Chloroflexota bacterium]
MKKKERGWAFIMVLIILAIGALVVPPALRLTYTIINSTGTISAQNKALYACEAAQEMVMWKLYHGTLVNELPDNGDTANFTVDVCGTEVDVSVVMRAVELEGGVVLATEHTMMPTKTVEPTSASSSSVIGPFTYTIAIEQVSANNTNGLDCIYDVMSAEFKGKASQLYKSGSSYISDDGTNWTQIDDPDTSLHDSLLRWPATGSFASPFRDFQPGETKYLRFQLYGPFNHNDIYVCNWVILQVADVFTLSGPQASLKVRNPSGTGCADGAGGVFEVTKTSYPQVIPPLEPTDVTYTMTIKNLQGSTQFVTEIVDYLPPGFTYVGPTTTVLTTPADQEPLPDLVTLNGVERYKLLWDYTQLTSNGSPIAGSASVTLTFVARAEQGVSGNYYNEVIVTPKNYPDPGVFDAIPGFPEGGFGQTYSWNTGIVIVPAYDSEAEAEGVTIDANMGLEPDQVSIISWHVK